MEGKKFDDGKLDYTLIDYTLLDDTVRVLMKGIKKYERDNWKYVDDGFFRYKKALLRHLFAWFSGEENDSESGISHLDHAMCNMLFLKYFMKKRAERIKTVKVKNEFCTAS